MPGNDLEAPDASCSGSDEGRLAALDVNNPICTALSPGAVLVGHTHHLEGGVVASRRYGRCERESGIWGRRRQGRGGNDSSMILLSRWKLLPLSTLLGTWRLCQVGATRGGSTRASGSSVSFPVIHEPSIARDLGRTNRHHLVPLRPGTSSARWIPISDN